MGSEERAQSNLNFHHEEERGVSKVTGYKSLLSAIYVVTALLICVREEG